MKKSTKKGVLTSLIIAAGTGAAALAGFLQDRIPDDVDEPEKDENEKDSANDDAEEVEAEIVEETDSTDGDTEDK